MENTSKRHVRYLILAVLFSLISSVASVLYASYLGRFTDEIDRPDTAAMIVYYVFATTLVISLCTVIRSFLQNVFLSGDISLYQKHSVDVILNASSWHLKQHEHGDLYTRLSDNLSSAAGFWADNQWNLISVILSIVVYLGAIIWIHWPTALIMMALTAVSFIAIPLSMRSLTEKRKKVFDASGEALSVGQNFLENLQLIMSENCAGWALDRYISQTDHVESVFRKIIVPLMLAFCSSHLITLIPTVFVIVYPCIICVRGGLTIAQYIALLTVGMSATSLLTAVIHQLESRSQVMAASQRIAELWNIPTDANQFPGKISTDICGKEPEMLVSMRDVTFRAGERTVIDHLTCDYQAGQTYIFTGPNGSGKSTCAKLIQAVYAAENGNITYHTTEKQGDDLLCARSMVSTAEQIPFIMETTFAANLFPAGTKETTGEQPADRLKNFRINEVLSSIDHIYLTEESLDENRLSGGQKKCISLARTFLSDTPVMIFDEPTSNIDRESACLIREDLINLSKRREKTLIIITHDEEVIADFPSAVKVEFCVKEAPGDEDK